MRGRKPVPAAIKRATGNPGRRPIREPIAPRAELLDPPAHVTGSARDEWLRLAPALFQLGILTASDRGAFAAYCEAYGLMVDCAKVIKSRGRTYKGPNGAWCARPEVRLAMQARAQVQKFSGDFGLTPAARERLRVDPLNQPGAPPAKAQAGVVPGGALDEFSDADFGLA